MNYLIFRDMKHPAQKIYIDPEYLFAFRGCVYERKRGDEETKEFGSFLMINGSPNGWMVVEKPEEVAKMVLDSKQNG